MRIPRLVYAAALLGVALALVVPGTVLAKGSSGGGAKGGTPPKPEEKPKPFKVGDVVKDVSIDKVDGGTWTPADASGKVALLFFAGKDKLGDMRKLHDLLKGREAKLVVLGVLEGIEKDKAKDDVKAEKEKIETTLGVDPKKEAVARFAASGTTAVAIIGTDGKLVYESSSYVAKDVEAQIEKLLPAAKPTDKPADKPGDTPPKK